MNNIEIKIWANPQGFSEITRQLPSEIFTQNEKEAFNPDGYDPISVPEFFSIFYAQKSYVISFHFLETESKLPFRDNRTILSVAIPRGYTLGSAIGSTENKSNILQVFVDLKKRYEELLNQLTDINELSTSLTLSAPEWIADYSKKLVIDELQPIINIPGTTIAKGFVLYDSSLVLQQFLETPVRMEFKGASLMLLLPSGTEHQHVAFLKSFTYVNAEPQYRPKYSLFFPAYKTDPIRIIYSFDESIDETFEKKYHETIHLNGIIKDHLNDWKIQRTSDNCGYNIGLQFQEQKKSYKIDVAFINLDGQKANIKDLNHWLSPSAGRIISEDNNYWLELSGQQIDNYPNISFFSSKEKYFISKCAINQSSINIQIDEVFYYDVPELKRIIEAKYHFSPDIRLQYNGQWIRETDRKPWKGNRQDQKVLIAESEEYEKGIFTMAQEFNDIKLKKKPGIKITIQFKGEILRWLEDDEKRKSNTVRYVSIQEAIEKNKKDTSPRIYNITRAKNEIEIPPFKGIKTFKFNASGFKQQEVSLYAESTEYTLDLQPTWWKRILKSKFTYMLICIILGYYLGCICHPTYFDNPYDKHEIEVSYQNTVENEEIANTQNDVYQTPITTTEDAIPISPIMENPIMKSTKPTVPLDKNNVNQSTANPQSMSPDLEVLITKLKGLDFNHADIQNAKNLARKEGLLETNAKFFEDCTFALSIATSNINRGAEFVKKQLPNHPQLSSVQKKAIEEIVKDDESFNSDNNKYSTINAMLKAYGIKLS